MAGDVEHDHEAQIAHPWDLVQEPGDPRRRETGQGDGEDQAEHQHLGMVLRRPGHRQHIVQRHGDIGHQYLDQGAKEGLVRPSRRQGMAFQGRFADDVPGPVLGAQVAPHPPAHP
jgi:hypothetical protein